MPDDHTQTQPPAVDGATGTFGAPDGTGTFAPQRGADSQSVPAIPGYEVLEPIGQGGMGRVYRARQFTTNRVVAVKLILAGEYAGAGTRERFKAEIETTAKLSHPHIVQLYEAGEADGRAFLSCEFVAGGSLAGRLDGTPWEAKRAARLLIPMARAVAHAHAAGIVHRDLKPANILLAADGTPKVADFGIAKQLGSDSHTHTGAILGTPSYMPPEQAGTAKTVGASADVYALGAILYELLTGRPPFKGANFVETIDLVRTQEPVPPRVLQPRLPRDIETVCLKCLQKDPAKRYHSAEALADDLERFLEGRPIVARPVGSIERSWRWAKRNPAVAGAFTAVAIALIVGTAVSAFFAFQAEARENDAKASAIEAGRREQEANDERKNAETARERIEELLYAAQIFQAHVSAVENRTERLNRLLEDTRPQLGRPDRRGWEWHYLRRLSRSWDVERKLDFSSPAFADYDPQREALTWFFSADGARAFVFGFPDVPGFALTDARPTVTRAGLFDIATGRLIRAVPEVKTPSDAAESYPAVGADLRYAVSTEAYKQRQELPQGQVGPPREVTRYRIRLINLETGAVETPMSVFETDLSVWVGIGGNRIVAALNGGSFAPVAPVFEPEKGVRVEVWNRGQPAPARLVIRPNGEVTSVWVNAVSADAMTALIQYTEGASDGKASTPRVELWDISGKPARRGPTHAAAGESHTVSSFSADGRMVVVSEGIRTVGVYDARTGTRVGRWDRPGGLYGQSQGPWCVSATGRWLAGTGPNGSVLVADRIGDTASGAAVPATPAGSDGTGAWRAGVLHLPLRKSGLISVQSSLSPDGRRLFTGDRAGVYREWDLSRSPGHTSIWPEKIRLGDELAASIPDARGRWVLYAPVRVWNEKRTKPFRVGVYDTERRIMVTEFDVTATQHVGGVPSPDGRRVLLTLSDPNPTASNAWDSTTLPRWSLRAVADPTRELAGGPEDSASFSEDGRWVVTYPVLSYGEVRATQRDRVRVYRVADGRLASEIRFDMRGTVVAGAWASPAGVLVVAARPEIKPPPAGQKPDPVPLSLRFHDIETGAVRGAWTLPIQYSAIKLLGSEYGVFMSEPFFSSDGRKVAVSRIAEDGSVRVWVLNVTTGEPEAEFAAPAPTGGRPGVVDENSGGPIKKGAFGPAGRVAVWADRDLVVWTGPGSAPVRLPGHENGRAAAFTADGRRAFTLDGGGAFDREQTLRVWELPAGRELCTVRIVDELNDFSMSEGEIWLEGERLHILTPTGVRVFDGTPLRE